MRIRVIDFETTGEPPEADVIEAAYVDVILDETRPALPTWYVETPGWTTLVRPTRPISIEARAVHHLLEEDVATGRDWGVAQSFLQYDRYEPPETGSSHRQVDYFCAHNAAFEKQLFAPEGGRWICTYKAALRLWPEAPRHSNSVLRYWLEGCDPGEAGMPPHRALPDCRVTALILVRALQEASVDQLVTWEGEPRWQPVIGFGKHRGKKWTEVPLDYIQWVLRQDFDDDTKWNAEQGRKR